MSILFITRRNVHADYYHKLQHDLKLDTKVPIMGKLYFKSLTYLPQSFSFSLDDIIKKQVARKQAKQAPIWNNRSVVMIYKSLQTLIERIRLAKYLYLFSQEKPQMVVLWNGKKLPNQTVDLVAKYLKIPVYYFENGLLPNTTSLDPNGVNQAASLPKTPSFYDQFKPSITPEKLPDIIARKPHKKRQVGNEICLPKRYIFVPFQVPHDTQIVQCSPWITSMEHLLTEVLAAVSSLNDEQLYIVVKEHPSWHKHYRHLYQCHPKVLFANNNETKALINNAEAVVTINSTVGLEALQLRKKVITLGDACYNIVGLCLQAKNAQQLSVAVKSLGAWQQNQTLCDNFFYYLLKHYCIPGHWNKPNTEHFKAIEKRLLGNDDFSRHVLNKRGSGSKNSCNSTVIDVSLNCKPQLLR